MKLSHQERRERRRKIAEAVRSATAADVAAQVANQFEISVGTVLAACREFGVKVPKPNVEQLAEK